jgi:glycosyltransferase 2 family protein
MKPSSRNIGRAALRTLLLLGGAAVLCLLGWTARDEFMRILGSVEPGYFALTVLIGTVFMFAQGRLFAMLLAKHGGDSNSMGVLAAFLASQPGKYVPGKIWQAVMQSLTLGRKHTLGSVAVANVELALIGIVHMTTLGGATLFIERPAISLAFLVAGVALAARIATMRTTALIARLPTRLSSAIQPAGAGTDDNPMTMPAALGASLLLAGLNLVAALGVLISVGDAIAPAQYAGILAVFYLGFAASFLALPVPAGLGVREAATVALGLILSPEVDGHTLISVALLVRCWQLATDMICLGAGATILVLSGTPMRGR